MSVPITLEGIVKVRRSGDFPHGKDGSLSAGRGANVNASRKSLDPNGLGKRLHAGRDQTRSICQDH